MELVDIRVRSWGSEMDLGIEIGEPGGREVGVVWGNRGVERFGIDGTVVGSSKGALTQNFLGSKIWSELSLVTG